MTDPCTGVQCSTGPVHNLVKNADTDGGLCCAGTRLISSLDSHGQHPW